MPFKELESLKIALKRLWILGTLASVILVLLLFFDDKETIKKQVPICMSIQYQGKPCFMCGSTSAFYEIAKGNWSRALELNKIAVFLFVLILGNSIVFVGYRVITFYKEKLFTNWVNPFKIYMMRYLPTVGKTFDFIGKGKV
jgi:hypothetical protein